MRRFDTDLHRGSNQPLKLYRQATGNAAAFPACCRAPFLGLEAYPAMPAALRIDIGIFLAVLVAFATMGLLIFLVRSPRLPRPLAWDREPLPSIVFPRPSIRALDTVAPLKLPIAVEGHACIFRQHFMVVFAIRFRGPDVVGINSPCHRGSRGRTGPQLARYPYRRRPCFEKLAPAPARRKRTARQNRMIRPPPAWRGPRIE